MKTIAGPFYRTLYMDTVGMRWIEGPLDLEGGDLALIQVEVDHRGATKSIGAGVAEVRGAAIAGTLAAFTTPATFSAGTTFRRMVKVETQGMSHDPMIDAVVTTAVAGLVLRFIIWLNDATS